MMNDNRIKRAGKTKGSKFEFSSLEEVSSGEIIRQEERVLEKTKHPKKTRIVEYFSTTNKEIDISKERKGRLRSTAQIIRSMGGDVMIQPKNANIGLLNEIQGHAEMYEQEVIMPEDAKPIPYTSLYTSQGNVWHAPVGSANMGSLGSIIQKNVQERTIMELSRK